jgi:uncharacterized protein YjbI with pentapeptide repeats
MSKSMELILKLHRFDNKKVLQALEELRACGGLEDGALVGIDLRYAHLQNADLNNADLQRVNLDMADLRWADLSGADLRGAHLNRTNLYGVDLRKANLQGASLIRANLSCAKNISIYQLAETNSLFGTAMPDGSIYDGRLNLIGDIEIAYLRDIDINNPESMANFYGISIEEFSRGQLWVHDHLPNIWTRKDRGLHTGINSLNFRNSDLEEENRSESRYRSDPYRHLTTPSF